MAKNDPEEEASFEAGPPRPQKRRARADDDDYDDAPEVDRPRRRRPTQGDDALATVIPYRNGLALAGYYCGVFSLIPCLGLVLGPVAFVLGILGLRAVKRNPEAKGTAHAVVALVLGGLTFLGHIAVILLMVVAGMKAH